MDTTDANLQTLAGYLEKTLSPEPTERRGAEKFLESVEANKNYAILLLYLIDKEGVPSHIQVSASIMFKNFVKRNWRVEEDCPDKIHQDDRVTVKKTIVGLMLKSPEQVQKQLSDAISIIGREDFPGKWPDLLKEMTDKFASGDFHIINGVLRTAHSIFKRYRHEFKSDKLWQEIKFVLDNFAAPFTELFKATMELAKTHAANPANLKIIFSSLVLICKIFYSLNIQDLPEYFEDHIEEWMSNFLVLLTSDNKLLQTEDGEEAGLMEQVKSQICEVVSMYAQKYDEEFEKYLPQFVTAVWNLLTATGNEVKYDLLVSNAIQFLASVAERANYAKLFEDPNVLNGICEKVIVPNMEFRSADEELFEDNPEEYIRRDIEGSDIDTRRRAACDLVKALTRHYEGPVIRNFSQYVNAMLQEYTKNPKQNWKNKDAAIFLITSLASKTATQKHGVTQTSDLVNVNDFFHSHIASDLQSPNIDEFPVVKADAIKYIMVFRQKLPQELLKAAVPLLVEYLKAASPVVHSYAAATIEKILVVKKQGGGAAVTKVDIEGCVEALLTNLFAVMDNPVSSENDYVMKALMRSFSTLQEAIVPYIGTLIGKLTEKLVAVSKNPSKPHFNHYLFESICIAIRVTCRVNPAAVASFEEGLFPPIEAILQQDVQEFIPYVFQLLSMLLELHETEVPAQYMAMFPHLLLPGLWERPANIAPLVRLLQAYVQKGATQIQEEQVKGLLGIFQKLVASKTNDHQGFYLMNTMLERMPQTMLQQFLKQIFVLLFQRLSSSKTTKYIKSLLVFFSLYAIKYSAVSLIDIIDSIQAKMFGMAVERLYISGDLQKVSGMSERKICAVGVTKILTEAPAMFTTYKVYWTPLLQALIKLFELPQDESVDNDEHFIEIEDTPGYQASFSQLVFSGKHESDPCAEVPDVKINLARSINRLSAAHPGAVQPHITELEAEATTFLEQYMAAANVSLV